jgi:prepilin-type N-terminal cleavage/methylation domain-containing protein
MKTKAHASKKSRRQAGFTLMDVMVVTLIIGILAGVGINRYEKYVARAKRPETVMSFRAIASAQREYLLTHGKYAGTFPEIGFNIEGGAAISPTEIQGYVYNYRLVQDQGPRSWYVVATGNIDGDPFPDIIAASNPR